MDSIARHIQLNQRQKYFINIIKYKDFGKLVIHYKFLRLKLHQDQVSF
jgi:hypothetical protein